MLMQKGLAAVSGRMPKMISPRAHAVIDYIVAGTFFAVGALLWRRNRRAAVGSLACGAVATISSVVTDYPGGIWPVMSFQDHGRVDMALSGFTAAIPNMLQLEDGPEQNFFHMQALAETAVTALTDFEAHDIVPHSRDWHDAA